MAHEWYDRFKKDVTAALNRGKTVAVEEAVSCTVVKMGDGSFLLCAAASAPKAATMVQEAKHNGGKPFSTGKLYKGDQGLTFVVEGGNAAVKKPFADASAAAVGKAVFVNVVEAATTPAPDGAAPPRPPIDGAAPTHPPTEGAVAPTDGAAFKDRMKAILPRVQQAGQKAPERKADLDKLAAAAVAAARANDLTQALTLAGKLDKAAEMILGAASVPPSKAPPPPPPPPPPSAVPPPAQDGGAPALAFKERMKEVLPRYKEAAQKAPDRSAELARLAAQAAGAAKAGDFAGALEFVEQLASASAKALRAGHSSESESGESESVEGESGRAKTVGKTTEEGEASESESGEGEPEAPVLDAAAFKARLKEVLPLYKQAVEKAPGRKEELVPLATQASAAGQAKDFAKAIDLLDQLEARSRSALRVAGVKEEIETAAGKGNVVFRKWRAEKLSAASALKELQAAILGDTESASALTDWDVITREAGRLGEMVEVFHQFDSDLESALEAYYTAGPTEREAPKAQALEVVQKYRQTLKGDPAYEVLDNGAYGPIKIGSVISAALDGLAAALK